MKKNVYISTAAFRKDILSRQRTIPYKRVPRIEFSGGPIVGYENSKKGIQSLLNTGVESILVHNYFPVPDESFVLNFASSDPNVLGRSFLLAERALELCASFAVPYYSFHPGYLGDGFEKPNGHFEFKSDSFVTYREALGKFKENIFRVLDLSDRFGVALAVENLFPAPNNLQTSLNCSMEEVDELLSSLPKEVGLLVDLGHLNVTARHLGTDRDRFVAFLMRRFPERIFEIHLSCNNGVTDEHLAPVQGDWQLEALKAFEICPGFSGKGVNVTLEARNLDLKTLFTTKALIENQW
ncbi:MAG: hypothetical protein EHM45_13785 [Desulfobacteraceae bacterium]|nr:MAG: hypothetical protein EHM45_13785 [Desulfobacteraceae bacterium]